MFLISSQIKQFSGAPFFRVRGVGMVEVLVALLVLSIGVLGYAGLQLRALKSTGESHFRTQAMAIAQDVIERIGVNQDGEVTYVTDTNWDQSYIGASVPTGWDQCISAACTATQVAQWDILQARWMAASLLPSGKVLADRCVGAGVETLCITVSWGGQTTADCAAGDSECVVLEVVE